MRISFNVTVIHLENAAAAINDIGDTAGITTAIHIVGLRDRAVSVG